MIVNLVNKKTGLKFVGVVCDAAEDCQDYVGIVPYEPVAKLTAELEGLARIAGWTLAPGNDRCPEHRHNPPTPA